MVSNRTGGEITEILFYLTLQHITKFKGLGNLFNRGKASVYSNINHEFKTKSYFLDPLLMEIW